MQDIVFYVAAKETHGIVRDSANANPLSAPDLVIGVSVCLKIRLFAACNVATPYPVASFVGVANWTWHMGADFDRDVPSLLVADAEDISVRTVTDTVDGQTMSFTEFSIPISDMDTQELSAWIGNARKRSGLVGELIGYDSEENAVFVLQVDDFTIWNRVDGLAEPTTIDREVPTRSETLQMIQTAVSSSAETKQDKLTSANAGTNISINENGVISNIYSLPSATNSVKGGVSLATDAETIAGSNAAKAITPASFKAALTGSDQIVEHSALKAFRQIDNLGSASTVFLASGRAYKLVATSGSHFLTVSDVPAGKYGMDAHLELFVGATALVHTSAPLILMDALVPNVVNDCVIKFRDGTARMFVEDHAYGYVVTVAGGTEGTQLEGSLYYGLTGSTQSYVVFANSLNGQTVTFPEGTTVNRIVNVVGNGYTQTILSGGVSCTSKTTFSNLGMNGVSVLGGTPTLGDVFLGSGATVSVSGGNLAIEKVTGSGGTIDLGGTNVVISSGGTAYASGCTFTGGSASSEGILATSSGTIFLNNVKFSSNTASSGALIYKSRGTIHLSGCTMDGAVNETKAGIMTYAESTTIENSLISGFTSDVFTADNSMAISGSTIGRLVLRGGTAYLGGYNSIGLAISQNASRFGNIVISSGAIVDLTGNTNGTPVNPGGGVTFEQGGATILTGATVGVVDAQYTLGGMTVPQIGNTNVVNLNNSNVVISSGATASASGCVFSGGSAAQGGALNISNANVTMSGCSFLGNQASERGGAIYAYGGSLSLSSCTENNNVASRGEFIYATGGCNAELLGGNSFRSVVIGSASVVIAGSNSVGRIAAYGGSGTVTISSGAIVDLTGNTNSTPIVPGGGILISSGGIGIIDSAGSTHEFQDLAITGSTINNLGQILGATVSVPVLSTGVGPWIVSTTLGSSTVSATAEAQELVIDGGLVSIQEL